MNHLNEGYYDLILSRLIFRYKVLDNKDPLAKVNLIHHKVETKTTNVSILKQYNLPKTMNLSIWKDFLIKFFLLVFCF